MTDDDSRPAHGGEVRALNTTTGTAIAAGLHHGRYFIHGLEVGGPYTVTVRRLGHRPEAIERVFLSLGQERRIDFRLTSLPSPMPPTIVTAEADPVFASSHVGITQAISDSVLRRFPSARRDLYEFVQLAPLVSTRAGVSGGGVGFRFNSFLIDGASERALQGGIVAGVAASKPISMEAVKEYQVHLTPFDARYGDFAGALVNAVTKSGTNTLRGSAFGYFRNGSFARDVPALRGSPYDRAQFGVSAGGPLVRNRAHFFVALEVQRLTAPAAGPFVGQSATSDTPLPVDTADVSRFARILDAYGIDAGSPGRFSIGTPLANLFARVDVALPTAGTRLVLRYNFNRVDDRRLSRPSGQSLFPFSSLAVTNWQEKHATGVQIHSTTRGGIYNEIIAQYLALPTGFAPWARAPQIFVAVPSATIAGRTAFLQAGSHEFAQGGSLQQRAIELGSNLTVPIGAAHRVTMGGRVEWFRLRRDAVPAAYGIWGFSSLDSLAAGIADSFRVAKQFGPVPTLDGAQYAWYVNDQWRVNERLSFTAGLRADLRVTAGAPPYNAFVDTVFARRTDAVPFRHAVWSPRLGFNWDMPGDRQHQLRGGLGIFAGRPPLAWLFNAREHYGAGVGTLRCGTRATNAGPAPAFTPDYQAPPTACSGSGAFRYAVNLVNADHEFVETLRAALGYDRRFSGFTASMEALYTRNIRDFIFVNRNLAGSVSIDPHGRVLYGAVDTLGSRPSLVTAAFSEVVDLEHHSNNYSFGGTLRVSRTLSDRRHAWASYTWSGARDVQTAFNPFAFDNWRHGRMLSGRHESRETGVSDYDQPHRVVLALAHALRWPWTTELAFYYVGSSGSPYTYVASANRGRGDLNADGTPLNDPVYVPRSALDDSEIRFGGSATEIALQQTALEAFIEGTPCLRRQRGRIMARNSCRSPWVNATSASIRQTVPGIGSHRLSLELDIFNVLNLLNSRWGASRLPFGRTQQPGVPISNATALLGQVGQTSGPTNAAQPVFRFDPAMRRYEPVAGDSYYQFQVAARYSF